DLSTQELLENYKPVINLDTNGIDFSGSASADTEFLNEIGDFYKSKTPTYTLSAAGGHVMGGKAQAHIPLYYGEDEKTFLGGGFVHGASITGTFDFLIDENPVRSGSALLLGSDVFQKTHVTVAFGLALSFSYVTSNESEKMYFSIGKGLGVSAGSVFGRYQDSFEPPSSNPYRFGGL
ncbi:MAG: hypothetical protein HRU08_08035, partial [Oleispira sp.]|nr:hypothetical protein [Oleispira sp.]